MMYRTLVRGLAATFLATLILAGCSDDPASSGSDIPQTPKDLKAIVLDDSTINLTWTAAADSAQVTGYHIEWSGSVRKDTGSKDVDGTTRSYTLTGAKSGQHYIFSVSSRKGDVYSDAASLDVDFTTVTRPPMPTDIKAGATTTGSIAVSWSAPSGVIPTGYLVSWASTSGGADSGASSYGPVNTATISGLSSGRTYNIYVRAMLGALLSDPMIVSAAASSSYVNGTDGQILRMYEKASTGHGSGLLLDVSKGGPKIVSASSDPTLVQLIWVIAPASGAPGSVDSVVIGTGPAFPEYANMSLFDQNVFISKQSYHAQGIAEFFVPGSFEPLMGDYNASVFIFPSIVTVHDGLAFLARTGVPGQYHYARLVLKSQDGHVIQGTAPNRYIELEMAYQSAANVPYAKAAGMRLPPVAFPARTR